MLDSGILSNNINILIQRIKKITNLSQLNKELQIMAVVKYAKNEDILSLIKDGRITIIGENKIQDAKKRWGMQEFKNLRDKIELHFIGHLQTNKIKEAINLFDYIDSLDSLKLALEINKQAEKFDKKIPVLIQIKTSDSPTQYGIKPEEVDCFLEEISKLNHISPAGIMTIAPNTTDEKILNQAFSLVWNYYIKYFKEERNKDGYKNYFSAGMSNDFETAIKNGSNLIRIGTLLFQIGEEYDSKS